MTGLTNAAPVSATTTPRAVRPTLAQGRSQAASRTGPVAQVLSRLTRTPPHRPLATSRACPGRGACLNAPTGEPAALRGNGVVAKLRRNGRLRGSPRRRSSDGAGLSLPAEVGKVACETIAAGITFLACYGFTSAVIAGLVDTGLATSTASPAWPAAIRSR
jgi:hypothetical protein